MLSPGNSLHISSSFRYENGLEESEPLALANQLRVDCLPTLCQSLWSCQIMKMLERQNKLRWEVSCYHDAQIWLQMFSKHWSSLPGPVQQKFNNPAKGHSVRSTNAGRTIHSIVLALYTTRNSAKLSHWMHVLYPQRMLSKLVAGCSASRYLSSKVMCAMAPRDEGKQGSSDRGEMTFLAQHKMNQNKRIC